MAATKTVLRVTNNRAVIRVVGTAAADTATITLNTDLVGSGDALTSGGTPTAIISKVKTSSANHVHLTRNSVDVGTFFGSDVIEESDWVLTDQPTSDVVVTFHGGAGMVLIELTKVSGYSPKFEAGSFGGNDNIAAVGS
jgi:hypothetical protein